MRLKKRNNSDIADLETAAFPIDVESFPKSDFITESGYPIDLDGAVNVDNWEGLAEAAFRPAFETSKAVRAIESQTFVNCKDFCEDALKAAVDNSYAITTEIRLPTEQEWEYVCRAGTQTAFWCGRLLSGVDVELVGPSISKVDFWASFDKDDLIAKIPDLPGGDESSGGRHKEWYSNRAKYLKFVSIDIDGVGHVFWHDWYATIGGELVVDGGSLNASKVVANFDEHYQHRYRADFYGTHTPILMIYELIDATNLIYEARPYADPTAADMYYKIMDRDEYILTTDLSLANTYVFEQYVFTHEDRWTVPKLHPGDWYTEGGVGEPVQLEYREMVPVYARYDGTGLRTKDGAYVKDFDGSLQPLRSLYVPAPYYAAGVYIGSTFPDIDLGTKTIESMVREVDLSDVAGVRMDTDDYILAFKQAVAAGILGKKYDPGFYSGPQKPKTVQMPGTLLDIKFQDEIEITVNTPPVDNSKITFERQVRNPWGLLSVHGNVAEWVDRSWDGRSSHALHKAGDYVITRGGSWKTGADICRSAARIACDPDQAYDDVGFRFIIND